jgi:hypothetical protein
MEPDQNIEDPQTEIGQLSDHLGEYVGIRRELFELKLWDKLFGAAAASITWGLIGFLAVLTVFMFSVGAALWIGKVMGNNYTGFFIVAGSYAVAALVLFAFRDRFLQKPLTNKFIDNLVNDDEEKENERNRENQQQRAA